MEFWFLPIQVDFHQFQICVEKYIFFASNRLLRFETKSSIKQNSESYLETWTYLWSWMVECLFNTNVQAT
jgi:hypothetical protein